MQRKMSSLVYEMSHLVDIDPREESFRLFGSPPVADIKVYTLTIKGKKKMGRGFSLEELTEGKDYDLKIVPYEPPKEPSEEPSSGNFPFRNTIEVGRVYPIQDIDKFQYVGYDPEPKTSTYRTKRQIFKVRLTAEETFEVISIN